MWSKVSLKRLFVPSGFLCLVGSLVFAYIAIPSEPEAFTAAENVIDFGELRQAQNVNAEFHLFNRFRKSVEIVYIAESCGCSKVHIDSKNLQSMQMATLYATWKTGTGRGPRSINIDLEFRVSGDERRYSLPLTMRGIIMPDIDYAPDELIFHDAEPSIQTLTLRPAALESMVIKEAYTTHRAFVARMTSDRTVEVAFNPSKWERDEVIQPHLAVRSNSQNEPVLEVKLRVKR